MLKLAYRAEASRRARVNEQTKYVSATNETTYNCVSKARESKMPGSSSVRSLPERLLKAARDEIDQIFRVGSISRPVVHHYQSFDSIKNKQLHKLIHRVGALSSHVLLGQGEQRSKTETSGSKREGGREQKMSP